MWGNADFDRDGYVILRNAVDHKYINIVWMNLHFLVAKQIQRFGMPVSANMQKNLATLLARDPSVYVNTIALASRLQTVHDLLKFSHEGSVLSIPSPPVMHVVARDLKIPNGYSGTVAHQDWASTQGSLKTLIVWIPITDTVGNFPIEVMPGSHKRGLLLGKINGSVMEIECKDDDFESLDAQFGDIIVMSAFSIHRTGLGGDGLRVAVSMRYEDTNEDSFVERGYPNAQKRVVDRNIFWKPSIEQVNRFFSDVD